MNEMTDMTIKDQLEALIEIAERDGRGPFMAVILDGDKDRCVWVHSDTNLSRMSTTLYLAMTGNKFIADSVKLAYDLYLAKQQ